MSPKSSRRSSIPASLAMASKCSTALVDPPVATTEIEMARKCRYLVRRSLSGKKEAL